MDGSFVQISKKKKMDQPCKNFVIYSFENFGAPLGPSHDSQPQPQPLILFRNAKGFKAR